MYSKGNLKKDSETLALKSTVEPFTNNYTLELKLGDKITSEQVKYNQYLHEDGEISETKLTVLFNTLLRKLK